ncbi:MAG: NTP transferase domain-containing protein [Balneolaceae bacterium]|nr:NTP transferase domain-containing protein [Balneolaceae bacterium]
MTDDTPKCMVEIAGKPILNHQLDVLTEAGIENIVVVTGYLEEEIRDPDYKGP